MHILNIILVVVAIWTIPWKIYAVWVASKHDQKKWFVALLILNTLSILEIFYIFKIAKKSWAEIKADFAHGWKVLKEEIKFKKTS
ncbi:MAG TPA: DUF5652 family protein [Candidatus Paceibacterota bacterium]|jgi:hypothetical protein|nr:DUF5652 family protein [Candidatus Paceibacterota bacterium]